MLKRLTVMMLIVSLLCTGTAAVPSRAAEKADTGSSAVVPIDGEYADGRVILSLISPSRTSLTKKGTTSFDADIRIKQSASLGAADRLFGTSKNSLENEFLQDKTVYITEAVSDRYSTEELIRKLENKAYVAEVSPDYKQYLASDDPYEKEQWYLDGKGSYQCSGSGISFSSKPDNPANDDPVIAVMDTGIHASHEDLADHLWINPGTDLKGTYGYDFAEDSTDCTDTSGHGTHCAGVIAATSDNKKGICGISNAKIMTLKIFDENEECYNSYIINALSYLKQAKDSGIPIAAVNCSWGGGSSNAAMKTLIRSLGQSGILFVFAAGNDTQDQDSVSTAQCPYDLYNTAAYSDLRNYIVTVGASTANDEAASFSDYGRTSVDLFAPGENIVSTYIGDTYFPDLYSTTEEGLPDLTSFYQSLDTSDSMDIFACDSDVGNKTSTTGEIHYNSNDFYGKTSAGCLKWDIHMGSLSFRRKQSYLYADVTDLDLDPSKEYYVSMMMGNTDSTTGAILWEHITMHSYGMSGSTNNRFYTSSDGHLYFRILGIDSPGTSLGTTTVYLDNIGISTGDPDTSDFGQYELMSGTSMAAPMITGALALCAAYAPEEDSYNRRNRLLASVREISSLAGKCAAGGILDLSRLTVYQTQKTPDPTPSELPEDTITTIHTTRTGSDTSADKSSGADTTSQKTVKIRKLKFKKKIRTLRAGHTYKLKIRYTPSHVSNKKLKWTSSRKKWASVSNSGVVRAKKKGIGHTVRITAAARDGSRKKTSLRIKITK